MKNQNELVLEIMSLCLEYNCDTLHVSLNFNAHVNQVEVLAYMGGWKSMADPSYRNDVYLNQDTDTCMHLSIIIDELKQVKIDHERMYSPEYIESTRERERLDKIESLQRQIDELG